MNPIYKRKQTKSYEFRGARSLQPGKSGKSGAPKGTMVPLWIKNVDSIFK